MLNNKKSKHIIDTRFTWSGKRAEEFLEQVKKEYGIPLPYGAVQQYVRLICAKFIEARKREDNNK